MGTRRSAARRRRTAPVILTGILVGMLLIIGGGVVSFLVGWVRGSLASPGLSPSLPGSVRSSENVSYGFGQLLPTWAGRERVTVLVLGVDERPHEPGPSRTDTLMLLTIDPSTQQAGVLSVPRDLWVPIPGHRDGRINTAHFLGELHRGTGSGPALAVETLEYNLGIPIDYYVRINFQAFVTLVDQIGGIDVYVESTIDDPLYPDHAYGYDPLYIEAGWRHFDGDLALKYARTRHGSDDFDRARRQQQVLMAILERVTSYELLPDLARNATTLYRTLEASVATDMALDQMLALSNLAIQVEKEHIRFGVIDHTCTQSWVTPEGAQVLIPLRDRMREVRDYVFHSDPPPVAEGQPTPAALPTPTPEIATLAVLNGTLRGGLAGSTADYLEDRGFDVIYVGNADRQDYAGTVILLNQDKPQTLARLLAELELPTSAVTQGREEESAHDIVVVLGQDFQIPRPE